MSEAGSDEAFVRVLSQLASARYNLAITKVQVDEMTVVLDAVRNTRLLGWTLGQVQRALEQYDGKRGV